MMEKELALKQELRELAGYLPLEMCDYAFAYGSGAVPQKGQTVDTKMADFILVVPDAESFHRTNLTMNPTHYSSLCRMFSPPVLAKYTNQWAAGVYFNTMVWIKNRRSGAVDRQIKYGIVQTDVAMNDLLDWTHLYVAGRLHKPVLNVLPLPDQTAVNTAQVAGVDSMAGQDVTSLAQAINQNLHSALHCALLQLPATFTPTELYTTIAALSYAGDFRMTVGEDKNKVSNIVHGSFAAFDKLYLPLLEEVEQVYSTTGDTIVQDVSHAAVYHHLNLLPRTLLWNMHSAYRLQRHILRYTDLEDVIYELAHSRRMPSLLGTSLARISRGSSITQTIKNIPTAGVYKSVLYATRKLRKMITSIK